MQKCVEMVPNVVDFVLEKQEGEFWSFKNLGSGKTICIHEVSMRGEKFFTCRVVKNLHVHRQKLRRGSGERFNGALL